MRSRGSACGSAGPRHRRRVVRSGRTRPRCRLLAPLRRCAAPPRNPVRRNSGIRLSMVQSSTRCSPGREPRGPSRGAAGLVRERQLNRIQMSALPGTTSRFWRTTTCAVGRHRPVARLPPVYGRGTTTCQCRDSSPMACQCRSINIPRGFCIGTATRSASLPRNWWEHRIAAQTVQRRAAFTADLACHSPSLSVQ